MYSHNIASCINLQLTIILFFKFTLSHMHHRETYMYMNFQQNRVSRSIKTVHTNLFAKINRKKQITHSGHALPLNGHTGRF